MIIDVFADHMFHYLEITQVSDAGRYFEVELCAAAAAPPPPTFC